MLNSKIALFLPLLSLCLLSCSDSQAPVDGTKNDEMFSVLDSDSVSLNRDDKFIYINYWAVWCAPCLEEMPYLAEFNSENQDRVEVYAVNYDRPNIEQLRADVEKLEVQIPSLLKDPREYLGADRPIALPTTLILLSGKVIDVLLGPQTLESLEESLASIAK